jgi:hypothetical protein
MGRRLESSLQVDDVGVIDSLQDTLLTLYVLDLLQTNYLTLFETLQGERVGLSWVISMLHQSYTAKGSCTKGRNEVKIVEVEISLLFPLSSALTLLGCVSPIVDLGVIQDILRLLLIFIRFLLTGANFLQLAFESLLLLRKSHRLATVATGALITLVIEVVLIVIVIWVAATPTKSSVNIKEVMNLLINN